MTGKTISHYRILEQLGEGGMGAVYRAEDTSLGRTVALKFLTREALGDEEIKTRLLREAQASAALDHPNICHVYGIHHEEGETFIAMAYVDGPSLADKIKRRPLPLQEALEIALQMAGGLQEAHEQGVVHRDIKPQNVMLDAKRRVKILDFGLAQLSGRSRITREGTTLGTALYMAPEQLEGGTVDRRTDIWALGVTLYEMLTQRTPFESDHEQSVAYAILNVEPEPVTARRGGLPVELDQILAKALAKDPANRYQHADDLEVDLRRVLETVSEPTESRTPVTVQTPTARPRRSWLRLAAGAVMLTVTAVIVTSWFAKPWREAAPPARRFSYTAATPGIARGLIAPDGSTIAYASRQGIWVRELNAEKPYLLLETERPRHPFWSPDSRRLAFRDLSGSLQVVSTKGEPPRTICESCEFHSWGWPPADWSPDGESIVFVFLKKLERVAASGGQPETIFELDGRGILVHPVFWSDDLVVLTRLKSSSDPEMVVVHMSSGEMTTLGRGFALDNSPSGHLIYALDLLEPGLWAMPLSEDGRKDGEPFRIAEDASYASVSMEGTLVYTEPPKLLQQLAWVDREGNLLGRFGQQQKQIVFMDLSADERFVAATDKMGTGDIWIHETDREVARRLPFGRSWANEPALSADGERVVFAAEFEDFLQYRIYERGARGEDEPLVIGAARESGDGLPIEYVELEPDYSPDGVHVIYHTRTDTTSRDLHYLKRKSDGTYDDHIFLKTPWSEGGGIFSPDGRFVAYRSDKSGRTEVYIRDFPDGKNEWQVSTNGGSWPRWRGDGQELLYGEGSTVMAVPVQLKPTFAHGTPVKLFELEYRIGAGRFEVTADGQRLVVIKEMGDDPDQPSVIHVWQNWYAFFRDREGTD